MARFQTEVPTLMGKEKASKQQKEMHIEKLTTTTIVHYILVKDKNEAR